MQQIASNLGRAGFAMAGVWLLVLPAAPIKAETPPSGQVFFFFAVGSAVISSVGQDKLLGWVEHWGRSGIWTLHFPEAASQRPQLMVARFQALSNFLKAKGVQRVEQAVLPISKDQLPDSSFDPVRLEWRPETPSNSLAPIGKPLVVNTAPTKVVTPVAAQAVDPLAVAESTTSEAMFSKGEAFRDGIGVRQNWADAAMWFRKAAEQGHPKAQYNLGACFERGNGVPTDPKEAVKWYRKAAEQGNPEAQCNLGTCYGRGNGVQQNYQEAANWFRKAAEQGDAKAQGNLGQMYQNGMGVTKDLSHAERWYQAAVSNGFEPARTALYQIQQEQESNIPATKPELEKEIVRLVSAIDNISRKLKTLSPPSSFRDPSNARMAAKGIENLIMERNKRIEKTRKCLQQYEINFGRKALLLFVKTHRIENAINI